MQKITLQNQYGRVEFTPYGAQVFSYVPAGGAEVLWRLPDDLLQEAYAAGKPLRGGIPICWPWFRQHPTYPNAPQHGVARTRVWQLLEHTPNHARLRLELAGTEQDFFYAAQAEVQIELADALRLTLITTNLDSGSLMLTQALHSYLSVGDVTAGVLQGLQGLPRWHLAQAQTLPAVAENFALSTPPEDRFGPAATGVLGPVIWRDTLLKRELVSKPHNATHTVVWHPGAAGAVALGIPAATAPQFICVEPARLGDEELAPGAQVTLGLSLRAHPFAIAG
jgi:glucose-6-phosphate 1-epimerase